jgi:hypothetical protein
MAASVLENDKVIQRIEIINKADSLKEILDSAQLEIKPFEKRN